MHLKNQLIVFTFLLLLALSIKPMQKNNQQNKPQVSLAHPSPSTTSKANPKKDVKATEVAKTASSQTKNNKKQVTTAAQTKNSEQTVIKVSSKPSAKIKEKSLKGKKLQKSIQTATKSDQKKVQQSNQGDQEKQMPKALKVQKSEGHNLWGLFIVYSLILCGLGYGVKYVYFPHSNNAFELLLDVIIKIKEFKLSGGKQGYRAPEYHQEVDDSNSITVGYTQDHAKQLFWQKNSVEGI